MKKFYLSCSVLSVRLYVCVIFSIVLAATAASPLERSLALSRSQHHSVQASLYAFLGSI